MTIDTDEQLQHLRAIGVIVADCLQLMISRTEEGMTTHELDMIGKQFLEDMGAQSAPQLTYDFPGVTCISIEHEAAHGIPSENRVIKAGQLINIDVSAEKNGFFADTGASFLYESDDPTLMTLCQSTRKSLKAAIKAVKSGAPLNVIGKAIEKEARKTPFQIIRNLASHGVGASLHEEPRMIPSYFDPRDMRRIHHGMVFTIEPFLSTKADYVDELDDGWTLVNPNGGYSAQYEHTLVATKSKAIIITQPSQGKAFQAV